MEIEELQKVVNEKLSELRINHSKYVGKRCVELAKIYGVDILKAEKVGLVHDIAKEMSDEDKIKYVEENCLEIDEIERKNTALLHAKIGADIAKKQFGFTNDMVEAIKYHTTGKENMCLLAKILFVADATGEDRNWDDLEKVRQMSEKSLDDAIIYILELNIKKNVDRKNLIHPDSIHARNYLMIKGN